MTLKTALMEVLGPYKKHVENLIHNAIADLGEKTVLRDACEYALKNEGKRFRPALVLMIAKGLGHHADVSLAALGIEFFHTASLIADDLPCMDNDDLRRDVPSLHKAFGESVALLSSYVLIASGYGFLAKNGDFIRNGRHAFSAEIDRLSIVLESATYTMGISGATGGQFLDLFPPNLSLEVLKEIIYKKTISLFELSFVMGWVFGGGDLKKLDLVKKTAFHFGFAFQVADDIGDVAQDIVNEHSVNIATVCGLEVAKEMFFREMDSFDEALKKLDFQANELMVLGHLLRSKVCPSSELTH